MTSIAQNQGCPRTEDVSGFYEPPFFFNQPFYPTTVSMPPVPSAGVDRQNSGISTRLPDCLLQSCQQEKGDGFRVQAKDGRRFQAKIVVNAAGGWGKNIAALAGDQLPIEPVALTMMVTGRMKPFLIPVVGVHGRKLSFKQVENGSVVIGGAHRAKLDMRTEINIIQIPEIKESSETVRKHFSIMGKSTIVRSWAGIEGMVSDGLPIIDESPNIPGLFHVCGFSAHGFQLAPMIGLLATSLVLGQRPDLPLDSFSMSRF